MALGMLSWTALMPSLPYRWHLQIKNSSHPQCKASYTQYCSIPSGAPKFPCHFPLVGVSEFSAIASTGVSKGFFTLMMSYWLASKMHESHGFNCDSVSLAVDEADKP